MKLHTPIEIEWLDSKGSYVVWQFKDEYDDDIGLMKTVGYFIKQTKEALIICQSISDDQYGKVFRIPLVSVKGITPLTKGKQPLK